MLQIDYISFKLTTVDEQFAHGLYADWDGFCRSCFESVVEESLSPHDKDKVLHEIELLDLDLGNIPEEDFYREFPRRLREELHKALPSLNRYAENRKETTNASRLDNLFYYLKHGYQKAEWVDISFNLTVELVWVLSQSAQYTDMIIKLCLSRVYVLQRLLYQTDDDTILLRIYATALSEHTYDLYEKRYFLGMLLESNPGIPMRFVQEWADDSGIHDMAELLNTLSVRRIIELETEGYAEINLSPYWHYLYEWLIGHYPFNGAFTVLGGKSEFIHHIHHRLLTFVRKRNSSFYLSKAELTVNFLLEVFGPTYYIKVLNAICDLQHHADDYSVYDSYFNRELYGILLHLWSLRMPVTDEEQAVSTSEKTLVLYPEDTASLIGILKDTRRNSADKRMLLGILAKKKPGILTDWLQTETAKDNNNALVYAVAEIADDTTINQLLTSVSFMAMEIVEHIRQYLRSHAPEIDWLNRVPESQLNFAIRKAVLLWIGNGCSVQSKSKDIRQLLRLIYSEITGSNKDGIIESLSAELHLSEKYWQQLVENAGTSASTAYIRRVKTVLDDGDISEPMKRRVLALFLERHKNNYVSAALLLQEHGVLEAALNLISQHVLDEIIRQSIVRISGTDKVTELLTLLYWLVIHESGVSSYLQDRTLGLKVQILVWLARSIESQVGVARTVAGIFHSLLAALFGKENSRYVIALISQETALETETETYGSGHYDTETALDLLLNAGEFGKEHPVKQDFQEWQRQSEHNSDIIETLLKSSWNADGGFIGWLEDTAVSPDIKRELLQKLAVEKSQDWIRLLRKQHTESKTFILLSVSLPTSVLLQSIARVDIRQAAVLSQTVEWLQRGWFTSLAESGSVASSIALSQALLLYMQDGDTLGEKRLTDIETVRRFMSHLHIVYTDLSNYQGQDQGQGQSQGQDQSQAEWLELSNKIAVDLELNNWQDVQDKEISDILSHKDLNDTVFRHYIIWVLEKQPFRLLAWLKKEADTYSTARITAVSDAIMLEQWIAFLPTVTGFEHFDAFRQLMGWLTRLAINRTLVSDTVSVLLSWLKGTDWREQTPGQMEDYFLSRLFGTDVVPLPMEKFTDATLPENTRRRLLYRYIRFQPKELLGYIQQSVERDLVPLDRWLSWLNTDDWMRLATNLSLSRAELLQQVMYRLSESNQAKEADLQSSLATYIIDSRAEEWMYSSKTDTICSFVQSLPTLQEKTAVANVDMIQQIKDEFKVVETEEWLLAEEREEAPECLFISNAGLCLLGPWIPRLFSILGYLDEDGRMLKDTESKIRAIFLLQYLTGSAEKAYHETELTFNRLLVALPMYIPLPKQLEMTDQERQTAESLLAGVKANWSKMNGTSVKGFQQNFIARAGLLEQHEEKWMLTVDNQPYDILLDTVPWAFRQIRFPWLKKYVQVAWHEKQEF